MSHLDQIIQDAEAVKALLEKAQEAIEHTLDQISRRGEVAWYMGHGTETFAQLTQALAGLTGRSVDEIEAENEPARCHDPRQLRVEIPGRIFADTVRPAGRRWDDMDEFYREDAARMERNLLDNYGLEVVAAEEDGE